jgi:hypothetical protein
MKFSQDLEAIIKQTSEKGVILISDFTEYFGTRSTAFMLALLTLPIALPFTPPGVNTPFGVVCIFLAINMIFSKKELKLPNWILTKKVPFKPEGKFFAAMTKLLVKIEHIVKPRMGFVDTNIVLNKVIRVGILCSSIVMVLPIPVVNSVSSLIVLMASIGIITKDGLVSLVAGICGIVLLLVSIGIIIYGVQTGVSLIG